MTLYYGIIKDKDGYLVFAYAGVQNKIKTKLEAERLVRLLKKHGKQKARPSECDRKVFAFLNAR